MLYGLVSVGGVSFTPAKDIPELYKKVIFITGGNVGLGKESALQLARHEPERIYLSCRDAAKADAAILDIQMVVPHTPITFIQCDLTSLSSIQAAAKEFLSKESRLDILMLNAGIMAVPPGTTREGYEVQFGTNHVGHALLTKLLMPVMLETAKLPEADVRVVALSSIGHTMAPTQGIVFEGLKSENGGCGTSMARYGQSKLANILFVRELQRRYGDKGITAVAVHPGVVNTELYRTVFSGAF
ncbi:putative oxidoreductase, partial [Lachnellula suecica]